MTDVDARALEALFFVSDEPLTASVLGQTLEADRRDVETACEDLAKALEDRGSGLVLRNVAGGWRLFTHPDVASLVERFVLSSRQARLTKAALETLSIVAYKQPVTRHQVSGIRGVNSDGVLRALTDRGLIEESGREETPGRPVLYGTTPGFLERLGLPSLASLPSLAPLLGQGADEVDGALADEVVDAGRPADLDGEDAPKPDSRALIDLRPSEEEDAPDAGLIEDDRPP
ncbi:MAG: SMC-Scp complex subunit ScpB [Actinomycetota bacterium]